MTRHFIQMEECWADARRLVAQLSLNTPTPPDMFAIPMESDSPPHPIKTLLLPDGTVLALPVVDVVPADYIPDEPDMMIVGHWQ